jgi:predicted lipase
MTLPKRHKDLIELCAKYSNDAYCKAIDGKFIENKETDTQAFVSFRYDKSIIITGQGTMSLRDWSIDFQIWKSKATFLGDTQVHSGFLKAYNSIKIEIHNEITKYMINNKEIPRIICTGHSLFGAIATICALDCALQYDIPIHCVTFGSPRVGGKQFVKLFNNLVDVSYRCIRHKDPITYTPLPIRFKHVRGGIHFGNDCKNVGELYNCIGCRVKHHSMEDYYEFSKKINAL